MCVKAEKLDTLDIGISRNKKYQLLQLVNSGKRGFSHSYCELSLDESTIIRSRYSVVIILCSFQFADDVRTGKGFSREYMYTRPRNKGSVVVN